MVRSGSFFARKDYNKFSSKKINEDFLSIQEWLDTVHRGNALDRGTGLIRNTQL